MGCDGKMHHAAAVMREHEKDEEQTESGGRNNKEVGRDQILHVILQKGSPALGGRAARTNHVLGDRGFGNLNAQFLEFAMDAGSTPAWICQTDLLYQFPNLARLARSALASLALPGPVQAESFTLPSQHSLRLQDLHSRTPVLPQVRQPDPEDAIRRPQVQPTARVERCRTRS